MSRFPKSPEISDRKDDDTITQIRNGLKYGNLSNRFLKSVSSEASGKESKGLQRPIIFYLTSNGIFVIRFSCTIFFLAISLK